MIVSSNDAGSIPTAPDLSAVPPGIGRGSGISAPGGLGDDFRVVIPPRPAIAKPLLVSHLDEANLVHRVQPTYPPIARLARVQGTVELRAIISKTGTVENLVVVSGQPMLAAAAIEAVRQWRYRPYLLNNQPIEVETEITVNFLLSGG
jgi:protein TonB